MEKGLHKGMTKRELLERMGEPDFVTRGPDAESWIYVLDGREFRVRLVTRVEAVEELSGAEEAQTPPG